MSAFRGSRIPLAPTLSILVFLLAGFLLMTRAGIEDDEALLVSGMYPRPGLAQDIDVFGHRIPIMLMTYVGALKSWLYTPLFLVWDPSPVSMRIPAVLGGALTIWLFYLLAVRLAGQQPAALSCILLATDTIFLMTTVFDWGPVMLQHLLLAGGLLCLVRFHQEGRRNYLLAGSFLFALGVWDKALFLWMMLGLAVATVLVFPRELRAHITLRNITSSAVAFCIGAAPFLFYNVAYPLKTFRANTVYSTEDFPIKTAILRSTFSGSGLFGYMTRGTSGPAPPQPRNIIEQASIAISERTGHRREGFLGYAVLASIASLPLLWATNARRPVLFSAIFMGVVWVQMALIKTAGTSTHHVVLLWPFPPLLCGVALWELSKLVRAGKYLLICAMSFLVASSSLVTNEYFANLTTEGPSLIWTDAAQPLAEHFRDTKLESIYLTDWGMFDVLWLLSQGLVPYRIGSDGLMSPKITSTDRAAVLEQVGHRNAVFVTHARPEEEVFKGVNAKLTTIAKEGGFDRQIIAIIPDRNGRPVFEIFRFSHPTYASH